MLLSGALLVVFLLLGAAAWLVARPPSREARDSGALARHPAGRSRKTTAGPARSLVRGPDDDDEFLRALDHLIRGTPPDGT